jgi:hypothetical protein
MARQNCEREPDVVMAVARAGAPVAEADAGAFGIVEPELRAHLAACESCRDAAATTAWMRQMADATGEIHAVPDPAVIWWKAQLLRRWEAERRATAPIERMHWLELAAGLCSLAAFIVWQGSGFTRTVEALNPVAIATRSASAAAALSPLAVLLLAGGTLTLGGVLFAGIHRRVSGQ